jgi:hypothetical protein
VFSAGTKSCRFTLLIKIRAMDNPVTIITLIAPEMILRIPAVVDFHVCCPVASISAS